ncbi:DUF58 domain-containing protein [Candidatus Woesearchaeota archaeon]|nr:DUF58 domain-containing protein [Candidatus Woesearchaeota archaeon]
MKEIKLELKPLIKKLEVFTKKGAMGEFTGEYKSIFKGRGMEFEEYRPYDPGHDDASKIDWKASLRAREILTKVLVEERNINVFFLFDVSNSMLFASTPKLKCEFAAELIASLTFAILQAQDSVGMAMFSDDIVYTLPPNIGARQYYLVIKALSNPQLYGGGFDIEKALRYIVGYLKRDSLLFIVSDFLGLHGNWKKYLEVVAGKYDVLSFMVRDPLDNEMPKGGIGQVVISDPFSHQDLILDPDMVRESYTAETKRQREFIKGVFAGINTDVVELATDQEFVTPILRLFELRGKRRR